MISHFWSFLSSSDEKMEKERESPLRNWPPSIKEFSNEKTTSNLPLDSDFRGRSISCVVHGTIPLYHPLEKIVDTPQFQRLRRLKQLGLVHMVYPSAEHSRFTHSLGAYHLARKWVETLRSTGPELEISSEDELCVAVAALCHDIGHGPFSHLFDNEFLKETNADSEWTHEDGSQRLLNEIFAQKHVRDAFAPYLGEDERFERNIKFIKELIHVDRKTDDQGNWLLEGRGREKSFLYDIVSNVDDGHDVDKYDYLLRDSYLTKVNITFGENTLSRLLNNMRVLVCPDKNYLRICYAKKVHSDLMAVGDSRQILHDTVYQHYSVRALDRMVVRAMLIANEKLEFVGRNKNVYSLSTCIDDMEAYMKTDDSILQRIENSVDDDLEEARRILDNVHRRNVPKLLAKKDFSPTKTAPIQNDGEHFSVFHTHYKRIILNKLKEEIRRELPEYSKDSIIVVMRNLNRGLDGTRHPAGEVLVYDNKLRKPIAEKIQRDCMEMRSPVDPTIMSVAVFVDKSVTEDDRDRVREIFRRVLRENGVTSNNTSVRSSPHNDSD